MCAILHYINNLTSAQTTEFTNTYTSSSNYVAILEVFNVKWCFSAICSIIKNMLMRFLGDFVNFTSANFDFLSDLHDCKQCPGGENWLFTPLSRGL